QRLSFSGKPKWYKTHWQMTTPRVQILDGSSPATPGIVPVYPLTDNLRTEQLRPLIGRALELYSSSLWEILPPALRQAHGWLPVTAALRAVHFPESLEEARQARSRFLYQEVLLIQLALGLRRRELRDARRASPLPVTAAIDERIRRLLPFSLTNDQNSAIADICRDLASDRPMQRLVQADVGAGKTAV